MKKLKTKTLWYDEDNPSMTILKGLPLYANIQCSCKA